MKNEWKSLYWIEYRQIAGRSVERIRMTIIKKPGSLIIAGVFISLFFYIAHTAICKIFSHPESDFYRLLLTPGLTDLFIRLLAAACIMATAVYASNRLARSTAVKGQEGHEEKTGNISGDPNLVIDMSHQLMTPLNAIMGFSELLRDKNISEISRNLYTHNIHISARSMMELINNIADITKIETGQLTVRKNECQINKLCNELYDRYVNLAVDQGKSELGIKLKTAVSDENFTIMADEGKIKQVLVNLLENALAFTEQGSIEFGYKRKDDLFIEFFVKDSGSGFSLERLEMVFERFSRVMDERRRPFDIAAMRINISKHLVSILGGELKAVSQLGQGATFYFTIPLTQVQVYTREEIVSDEDSGVVQWKNKKILIADDAESNFLYLKEILVPSGVQVEWAKNGSEAVELYKSKKHFDLVLMDILMPEMDGYEAARLIKKINPKVPVIAQTAYSIDTQDAEILKYFDKYLIKPIWSHDLLNALSIYLA